MKRLLLLLCSLLMCTACTALPAEERAFAVALGISGRAGAWTVYARVPLYQKGGGYRTVTGWGDTIGHALAALDAAAPMQLHLGQLRLLVFAQDTACSEDFLAALGEIAANREIRPEAALAVSQDGLAELMEALKPPAGARLSKALDVLLETRAAQGVILPSTLSDALLMGERQQPVLINVGLNGDALTLSGGWPVGVEGLADRPTTPADTQPLSLMTGQTKRGALSLDEGVIELSDARAETELQPPTLQQAAVRLTLRCTGSPLTEEALSRAVASACLGVLNRLSAMGCDALGLGGQAVRQVSDMTEWHDLAWPERYRELDWSVSVGISGPVR